MHTFSLTSFVILAFAAIGAVNGTGTLTQAVVGSTSNGNTINLCTAVNGKVSLIDGSAQLNNCKVTTVQNFNGNAVTLQVVQVVCNSAANQGRTTSSLTNRGFNCVQYSVAPTPFGSGEEQPSE
ncbi:hypothetical protein BZG36_03822 [Bifiguratus adelaidae]|uniref:Cyanovirin-N domain-containing protein n=1 Tax=Bifiguratus adelaidae TaxID=1938954 RepID=A0A261XZN1_9FUNG|nr:hypothetical protein BZG36_03822 [Bifiguratus adelaidae]